MTPHSVQEIPCQKWLSIKEIFISVQFTGIHSQITLFQVLILDVHISRTEKLVFHHSSQCALQVRVREHIGEAASTIALVGHPWLAAWGCLHTGEVLNSDILQCGQNASVVQGTEFKAALKSLVLQSIHAAQVLEPCSFLLRHHRMVVPTFSTKHPWKGNWTVCKSQKILQKISTKNFQQNFSSVLSL